MAAADIAAPALLLVLAAALFLARYDALPLQLWDESRNANNALEMASYGHWLTPTYAGAIDHWNTKPPLLIWVMAVLLKCGLPPLLALRLPSMIAAAGSALMIWGVLRLALKDRLGALAGGVLLLGPGVYIGWHGAATGDYDAPEAACLLAYVLFGWAALETRRFGFVAAAAAALTLGLLTKGVAAALALPGLGLYALARPRALSELLRDWRTWAAAAGVIAATGGYYLVREAVDPGYLTAVANNELGGRFLHVTEHHQAGAGFYVRELVRQAEPCAAAAMLALLTLRAGASRRRRLAWAVLASLLSLLAVLSASRSKMEWYAVPMVPLLAVLGGLGLSELARLAAARGPAVAALARGAVGCGLAAAAVGGLLANYAAPGRQLAGPVGPQYRYGAFLGQLRARGSSPDFVVVDGGFFNDAGFVAYHPMLRFYATLYGQGGRAIRTAAPDAPRHPGEQVASCDPAAVALLQERYVLKPLLNVQGCVLYAVEAPAD